MKLFIPVFYGMVTKGTLKVFERSRMEEWIKTLDGKVEIVIKKITGRRTDRQLRYYWAYLHIIADDTGEDPDTLHWSFKWSFLPRSEKVILGETVVLPGSTRNLSKQQFSEYIQRIEARTGIPAPNPDMYYVT